jgi:beta-lactam-binding protein with PASTA domain
MAKNKKPKSTTGVIKPLLIIIIVLLALYLIAAYLFMPMYTRHWQRVHVPDVRNLSLAAAQKVVKFAKLEPVIGEVKYDDSIPAGYVSFQNPLEDSYVKKGRRIYLTQSKGRRPVVVPNLIGTNLRDAKFNIAQHQLELGKLAYEFDRYYPEGVVMDQAIAEKTEIMAGSAIDLTISLGEEPDEIFVPNLYGKTLEEAELLMYRALLTKGRVSYSQSDNFDPNVVIFQSLDVGTRAAKGDTINIAISRFTQGGEDQLPW